MMLMAVGLKVGDRGKQYPHWSKLSRIVWKHLECKTYCLEHLRKRLCYQFQGRHLSESVLAYPFRCVPAAQIAC